MLKPHYLHSNMVRFIINNGEGGNADDKDLHSNMVRFIIFIEFYFIA